MPPFSEWTGTHAAGRFIGSRRLALAPSSCWFLLVLRERHLPGYDAKETIENRAAERSTGVYGTGRHSGELERSVANVERADGGVT